MQWLHDFINNTMQEWKVPGLAIAIVKDNEIIFSEGFGLRDVEKGLKVTPQEILNILATDYYQLKLTYNSLSSEIQHYHYDIFELKFEPIQFSGLVSFFSDTQGNISGLSVPLEPALKPILFTKSSLFAL